MEYLIKCYFCDNSLSLTLKIIFQTILETSTYPDLWKLVNVIPIIKKGVKQLIKYYRRISLLPISGKIFANNLISKILSSFRPGDSTTNQLLYLVNEIHDAFEGPKSLFAQYSRHL